MKSGILYMASTGRIVGHSSGDGAGKHLLHGMSFMDSEEIRSGDTYYILNGQPTERPASPVTLSDLTLQGLPAGSTLMINGDRYEGVAGDVELEFPLPGTYQLRVECFPHLDWEVELTV